MLELNQLYNMDCMEGMKRIPAGSVDLVDDDFVCDEWEER